MGTLKNLTYESENYILDHREIAENDPLNLLVGSEDMENLYKILGTEKKFIEYVWKILDDNE